MAKTTIITQISRSAVLRPALVLQSEKQPARNLPAFIASPRYPAVNLKVNGDIRHQGGATVGHKGQLLSSGAGRRATPNAKFGCCSTESAIISGKRHPDPTVINAGKYLRFALATRIEWSQCIAPPSPGRIDSGRVDKSFAARREGGGFMMTHLTASVSGMVIGGAMSR